MNILGGAFPTQTGGGVGCLLYPTQIRALGSCFWGCAKSQAGKIGCGKETTANTGGCENEGPHGWLPFGFPLKQHFGAPQKDRFLPSGLVLQELGTGRVEHLSFTPMSVLVWIRAAHLPSTDPFNSPSHQTKPPIEGNCCTGYKEHS